MLALASYKSLLLEGEALSNFHDHLHVIFEVLLGRLQPEGHFLCAEAHQLYQERIVSLFFHINFKAKDGLE